MREFNTKITKGNYSITFETDDKKAFEQVQSLCRLLIDGRDGEAIPIEWIRKWYHQHSPLVGSYVAYMLLDWKQENETDR